VRERLVDRSQLDRKARGKKGDPRNPALASAALLDFIGPAHSAEELRLPMPVAPAGLEAEVESAIDRPVLAEVAGHLAEDARAALDQGLGEVQATPERLDRLRALLHLEAQMLCLVGAVAEEVQEIERRRREESQGGRRA
jgi:hypothetical protein